MHTFKTYFIFTLVLLGIITNVHEARSLPGVPAVRAKSSHFLDMCQLSHSRCMRTGDALQCTTCRVTCTASSLPDKARQCADRRAKRHRRSCALYAYQWDRILSELRFVVNPDEQSRNLPSVVGRWEPDTCAETNTPCARCCEHEYYWCHRGGDEKRCRHCIAAADVCASVSDEKVAVFNSNLPGWKRAAIAMQSIDKGICNCVPGFYC